MEFNSALIKLMTWSGADLDLKQVKNQISTIESALRQHSRTRKKFSPALSAESGITRMMTIAQLRTFLSASRHMSFSRAAEELHLNG